MHPDPFAPITVDLIVTLFTEANGQPITARMLMRLGYNPGDPFAVTATFQVSGNRDEDVTWMFARELLRGGLIAPTPIDSDVRVYPGDYTVVQGVYRPVNLCIVLSSPFGTALFKAGYQAVVSFVTRIFRAVPDGEEWRFINIDRELRLHGLLVNPPPEES